MKKKKIKRWTKHGIGLVKLLGVGETAKQANLSADHMSAMLCGRVATTAKAAEWLVNRFPGTELADFGQAKKKGEG